MLPAFFLPAAFILRCHTRIDPVIIPHDFQQPVQAKLSQIAIQQTASTASPDTIYHASLCQLCNNLIRKLLWYDCLLTDIFHCVSVSIRQSAQNPQRIICLSCDNHNNQPLYICFYNIILDKICQELYYKKS